MNWILIAITSGMLMTKSFDNEEACLGRKAMLEKDKISNVLCVEMPGQVSLMRSGAISVCSYSNGCLK